jgi:hypothetical protein
MVYWPLDDPPLELSVWHPSHPQELQRVVAYMQDRSLGFIN